MKTKDRCSMGSQGTEEQTGEPNYLAEQLQPQSFQV